MHAYPVFGANSLTFGWSQAISAYENLTNKPIYITEFGMPEYNQTLQEEFMDQSFALFRNITYIKAAYWYDLWGRYGLLNSTNPVGNQPNKAWNAFLKYYRHSLSVS